MRLNPDCVRDVLSAVESLEYNKCFTLDGIHHRLPQYTPEELSYTCLKLEEGGYLDLSTIGVMRSMMPGVNRINDLTFRGHEFLNEIRSNENWAKVKDVARKVGAFSLSSIAEIGKQVTAAAIAAALQSHP